MPDAIIYTLRPRSSGSGSALWLPADIAKQIKAEWGDTLTEAQFSHKAVKAHLAEIREREKSHKRPTP